MPHWFKNLFTHRLKIENQTIHGDVQQADTINNVITAIIHIPKKIVFGVAVLLISLIVAVWVWRGNSNTISDSTISNSTIYQASVINQGIPPEQLIELAEKLGVVNSEREEWKQKYKDLEKQLAGRSDEIAKQAQAFLVAGNLGQAETLFKQALANDIKNAAANAFSLAQIKELQLNQAEAKTYYQQATQLAPDNAYYWNQLGHFLSLIGDLDEAMTAYSNVLALGEAHKNQQEIAVAVGNLGIIHRTRGDLDKAIEFQQKALTLNEALGSKEGMALNYGNLGSVYYTRGDLDKAIEFQQKALGGKQGMAADYGNLGNVYFTRGDLDKAIEFHQKALTINESMGNKQGMALDYGNLGNVYYTRGDLDKAIEFYQNALTLNEALGRKEGMAADYGNLGIVYKTRGDLNKAIEFYQKSLAITEALGMKETSANQYTNLGNVYEQKGNIAEAKRYYQKSIELFKYLGSPNEKLVQGWLDALH